MTFTLMPIVAIFLVNLILILLLLTMVDDQVVYRALTCCLPGMRVMLLEARSRLTKTKKPGQVILLIVIILLILMMKTLPTNQNNKITTIIIRMLR